MTLNVPDEVGSPAATILNAYERRTLKLSVGAAMAFYDRGLHTTDGEVTRIG